MANAARPAVEITLDRPRKLAIDFNAICRLEEETGLNVMDRRTWENPSASDLRAILWASLLADDPGLTLGKVGEMMSIENVGYITEKLAEAWFSSLPDGAAKGAAVAGEDGAKKNGTGA